MKRSMVEARAQADNKPGAKAELERAIKSVAPGEISIILFISTARIFASSALR